MQFITYFGKEYATKRKYDENRASCPDIGCRIYNIRANENKKENNKTTLWRFYPIYWNNDIVCNCPIRFYIDAIMIELIPLIILLAFLFETMDSSAGMGFGTGLTPLLFLLGYDPLQVVPILLISEAITGFTASYFHHEFENVSFSIRKPLNPTTKITMMIAITGCFAIIVSVFLTYAAFELPKSFIKTYVAILVLAMGIIGIFRLKRKNSSYRPKLLTGFAALAGFNKGIGAGGYGPVVMMGQLFSGIYEKTATAIVSLAEGIVSLVGFATFIFITSYGVTIDYLLLPSIFTGGFIAAIISPYIVRVLPNKMWRIVIPVYAVFMGVLTLAKVYNFIP